MKQFKNCITAGIMLVSALIFAGTATGAELGGVDIHGFASQGFVYSDTYNYLAHDSTDGSFQYNEIGINFSKELTDKLRLGVQLFSRDLGDVANNKINIDWAYGDYRIKDWLGIRAGRIKLPISLYNETRDLDMLRTNIIMPQSIYNDFTRDNLIAANGLGLYGNIPLSDLGDLDYQIVAGAMNIDNDSGTQKFFENANAGTAVLNGDIDSDTLFCASLRWNTPLEGLLLALHGVVGENEIPIRYTASDQTADIETEITQVTLGLEYLWENLKISSEYMMSTSDVGGNSTDSEAWYIAAAYRFTDLVEAGVYYSVVYPDKDDRDGDNMAFKSDAWEKDLALSLRFDINEYTVFKVEGHHVDGTVNVMNQDNPDRTDDKFWYGAAKLTFSF